MTDRTYTRSDVTAAVDAGTALILDALDSSERDCDLIDLLVNAVMSCLDNPQAGVSFEQVVRDNYVEHPDTVRAWWSRWN